MSQKHLLYCEHDRWWQGRILNSLNSLIFCPPCAKGEKLFHDLGSYIFKEAFYLTKTAFIACFSVFFKCTFARNLGQAE